MATSTETRTVTKKELIDRIADETGEKRVAVKKIVQSFLDEIVSDLGSGNRLEFRDFGVFEVRERKARIAQNPKTLEPVEVPAKWSVRFKAGRLMRQATELLGQRSIKSAAGVKPNENPQIAAFTEAKPNIQKHANIS